jgi:hypothetical protein
VGGSAACPSYPLGQTKRVGKGPRNMIIRVWLLLFLTCMNAQPSEEQLYLITGIPSTKLNYQSACSIYKLEGGQVKKISDIANQDTGIDFVDIDYDSRHVVVGIPPRKPSVLAVLKMESPELVYAFSFPLSPDPFNSSIVGRYFLIDKQKLGFVQEYYTVGNPKPDVLVATWLFSAQSGSDVLLPKDCLPNFQWSGKSGTVMVSGTEMYVRVGAEGKLIWAMTGDSFEIQSPPQLTSIQDRTYTLSINNNKIAVLDPWESDPGNIYVMNKASGVWRTVSVPPNHRLRAFGEWVAGIVGERNQNSLRESPGKEFRQKEKQSVTTDDGRRIDITVENMFEGGNYYPGVLFAYNSKTERSYEIKTGQGDSEIILATNSTVYYRVNDTIFRAPLEGLSLGKAVQIAKGPQIIQVHWAFIGPD